MCIMLVFLPDISFQCAFALSIFKNVLLWKFSKKSYTENVMINFYGPFTQHWQLSTFCWPYLFPVLFFGWRLLSFFLFFSFFSFLFFSFLFFSFLFFSFLSSFFFFFFLFLFVRESTSRGRGRQEKPAPHDLSWRQALNRLSHPGAPTGVFKSKSQA